MSVKSTISGCCIHCNFEQHFSFYLSVNVTENPELKSSVLTGLINTNICFNCQKENHVEADIFYQDHEHKVLIEMSFSNIYNESLHSSKLALIEEFENQGYIYRKVYRYCDFVEKIKIFDKKLNDVVIQRIKNSVKLTMIQLSKKIFNREHGVEVNITFKEFRRNIFSRKFVFDCMFTSTLHKDLDLDINDIDPIDLRNLYNMDMLRRRVSYAS